MSGDNIVKLEFDAPADATEEEIADLAEEELLKKLGGEFF